MFITESLSQKNKNDEIRMRIFRMLVEIYDTRSLEVIQDFVMVNWQKEVVAHPYTVDQVTVEMDLVDLVHIMDALKGMDRKQLAVQQMCEAFGAAIDSFTGIDKEEK